MYHGPRARDSGVQSDRRASLLGGLLVVLFVVVQVTALTHELAHASGEHDAPCGLHVAADHLVMAPAPDVPLGAPIALANAAAPGGFDALPPVPVRWNDARAPPRLA
jgi:hypothetical protein